MYMYLCLLHTSTSPRRALHFCFFHPSSCTLMMNGPFDPSRQTDRLLPPACVAPAGAREKPHRPIDHRELRVHVLPSSSSSLPFPSSKQSFDTHSALRVTYPPSPSTADAPTRANLPSSSLAHMHLAAWHLKIFTCLACHRTSV